MQRKNSFKRNLVLIGAGHSHVQVIKILREHKPQDVKVTLINDRPASFYSGMLPACVAGLYDPKEIQVDLHQFTQWAGVHFICSRATNIDTSQKKVFLNNQTDVSFDLLSINVGSVTVGNDINGVKEFAVSTRPLSRFLEKMERISTEITYKKTIFVVVGGGSAGVELAFAFYERFRQRCELEIILIEGAQSILSGQPGSVIKITYDQLLNRHIKIKTSSLVKEVEEKQVILESGEKITYDYLIWSTGAAAPPWLQDTDLDLDQKGFIQVNTFLQSSHQDVFAAGDCINFADQDIPKAGVYAVREGPVLTHNLLARLKSEPLKEYKPQAGFLSLMMTGDRKAIMNWKGQAFYHSLIWKWKDFIDKRWMKKFNVKI